MQNSTTKPIGLFGGTFDPVHIGHLKIVTELLKRYDWQEIRLIPCRQPVLPKNQPAIVEQRLAMLKLAIADKTGLTIDERELKRETPSYTVETLLSLRQELPNTPLCLIMGVDALANLDRWHQWQKILELAHIVVVSRPDYVLPTQGVIADLVKEHLIRDPHLLEQQPAGAIYITDLVPLDISSTAIRHKIATGEKPVDLLPKGVWDYIVQHKLYQK